MFNMFESSVGVQSWVRSVHTPPAGRGWNYSHMFTKMRRCNCVPAKLMLSVGNILFTHTRLIKNNNLLIFIKQFLIK